MKEHVYPDDIKAIPVKQLSPAKQLPFVNLATERHRLWSELVALEEAGYGINSRIEVPVRALVERFRSEHPKVRHATLFQLAGRGTFAVTPAFRTRSFPRAKVKGPQVIVDREVAVEVGDQIVEKESVARLLARYFAALPGTFAEHQDRESLPEGEEGLLALLTYIDGEESDVRRRKERIEEIGREIDRLAWDLYRPEGTLDKQ